MANDLTISLIIPCYNEQSNIQKGVLDKIGNFTEDDQRFTEVLIVDDGSTDQGISIINERYLTRFKKFRLIENPHQGKAYAIIKGMNQATSKYVMFSDIDLATPIEEANKLIDEIANGYKIIIGSRNNRREGAPLLRRVMSNGAVLVKNYFLGLHGVKDTQCGFKLFERKTALNIIKQLKVFHDQKHHARGSSVTAGFDFEFLFIATKRGLKIKEVPVHWRHVETKNVHFLDDTIESLKDIFAIKMNDIRGYYNPWTKP